ncbi:hypothetical protein [Pararcticibacter amylolyticus]|uniref:Lipoprotein n=1 Tax=Pararcticibacter amylolyticus TaxID=2173175 RepID=A0A2U2PBI4_9SPHI|nr:hypothetical protein [Pararcticibacter amylolyticus]PWG78479.1 hypothetical protein DDR33_21875 [Pararcticibacter amylolyticus]
MKKWILSALVIFLIQSCTQKKLDKEQALQVLKESKIYPRTLDVEIITTDPNQAARLINTDLEKAEFITIKEAVSLGDMGQQQIILNDKAAPYLIPVTAEEKSRGVQRVKVAEEDISSITDIRLSDNKKEATVEYTTVFKNITPFSSACMDDLKKEKKHEAGFVLESGKWKLHQAPQKVH